MWLWPSESASQGELEHLLRARREGALSGAELVSLADDAADLVAHLLDGDVERLEHAGGEALLLAEQAEENVLRADVVVLQRPGLVRRENDDLASPLGKAFEHVPSFGRVLELAEGLS